MNKIVIGCFLLFAVACKDSKTSTVNETSSKDEMNSLVKDMEVMFKHSTVTTSIKTANGCQYSSLARKVYDLKSDSLAGEISFERILKQVATPECGNIDLTNTATVSVITKKNPKEVSYCLKSVSRSGDIYQITTCDDEKGTYNKITRSLTLSQSTNEYVVAVIIRAQNFSYNDLMNDLQNVDIEFLRYDELNDVYVRDRQIKNTNAVSELALRL